MFNITFKSFGLPYLISDSASWLLDAILNIVSKCAVLISLLNEPLSPLKAKTPPEV